MLVIACWGEEERKSAGFLYCGFAPNPAWHFQHVRECAMPEFPGIYSVHKNKMCLWCLQSPWESHCYCSDSFGGFISPVAAMMATVLKLSQISTQTTIRSFSFRDFHYFESIICRDLWKPHRCFEVLMFRCISLLTRVLDISKYPSKYFSPHSSGKPRDLAYTPSVVLCVSSTLS